MTEPQAPTPVPATPPTPPSPAAPLRLPAGMRGWAAGVGLVVLLTLAEFAWPVHAYFESLDIFLFHGLFAAAASIALIAATRIAERILVGGDRDDG